MTRISAALALALALAACGGDNAATTTTSSPPATTTPTTAAATTSTPTTLSSTTGATSTVPPTTTPATTVAPTTTTEPDPGRVTVQYTGGELSGGLQQVQVDAGTEVTLVVETDVTDEVHVHGYDLFFDVSPGVTEFSFVADIPGIFEAELEGLREPIVKLEVR